MTLADVVHNTAVAAWNDTIDPEGEAAALAAAAAAVEDKLVELLCADDVHAFVDVARLARATLMVCESDVPVPLRRAGGWYPDGGPSQPTQEVTALPIGWSLTVTHLEDGGWGVAVVMPNGHSAVALAGDTDLNAAISRTMERFAALGRASRSG